MLASSIPTRFQLAWAKNAGASYIRTVPVASQIGVNAGAASYNDGFVPDNFTQIAAGGVPPFGQDMNGVLNETTVWDQWYQAGGPISFDATFAAAIGGYPKGAILDSAITLGVQWFSTADNNTTSPDDPSTSTNWARVGLPAGTPLQSLSSTVPPGFVAMNALTIGSAASNAGYASADALFLFCFNWLNFSNAQCPILTSAGGASTRGANPWSDFAANKQLTLPNGKGLGLIGADTMGGGASTFLNGVPVTIGNTTAPGSIVGENLHTLITNEIPSVTPSGAITNGAITISGDTSYAYTQSSGSGIGGGGAFGISGVHGIGATQTTSTFAGTPFGGGGSHNDVERSMIVFWGQKL